MVHCIYIEVNEEQKTLGPVVFCSGACRTRYIAWYEKEHAAQQPSIKLDICFRPARMKQCAMCGDSLVLNDNED